MDTTHACYRLPYYMIRICSVLLALLGILGLLSQGVDVLEDAKSHEVGGRAARGSCSSGVQDRDRVLSTALFQHKQSRRSIPNVAHEEEPSHSFDKAERAMKDKLQSHELLQTDFETQSSTSSMHEEELQSHKLLQTGFEMLSSTSSMQEGELAGGPATRRLTVRIHFPTDQNNLDQDPMPAEQVAARGERPKGPAAHEAQPGAGREASLLERAGRLKAAYLEHFRSLGDYRLREAGVVAQAAAATGAIAAVGWGWSQGRSTSHPDDQPDRSLLLDNAKVFALFLVIFGHFLMLTLSREFNGQQAWLTGAEDTMKTLMVGISPLELPVFCFVSGICSQGETTPGRLRRFFMFLVAPTSIWVFFAKPVVYDTLIDASFSSAWGRVLQALQFSTFHNEWYLQALIFWRGSTLLIWNHLRPAVALVGMFGISLAGGYMSFGTGAAANLKIDETLGFMPYFALGYVFPYEEALRVIGKPGPLGSALAVVAVAAYTAWFLPQFSEGQLPNAHGPYGAISDHTAWLAARHNALAHALYWIRRLAKVGFDMVAGLAFMFLVLPRSQTFLSWAGQHTLHPYVWHLLALTWWDKLLAHCTQPVVTLPLGHAAVLGLNAAVCMLIVALFSCRIWRTLFAWCFNPTWLQCLLEKPPGHHSGRRPDAPGYRRESGAGAQGSGGLRGPGRPAPESRQDALKPRSSSASSSTRPPSEASSSEPSSPAEELLHTRRPSLNNERHFKQGTRLPTMQESKAFSKLALPIFALLVACPLAYFFLVVGCKRALELIEHLPLWLLVPLVLSWGGYEALKRVYHFKRLWRGLRPPAPLPEGSEPLLHVCVVVEYKEPLEVLTRTAASIASQSHIARRPVLVVATEARDPERQETCEVLRQLCGDDVEDFLMTEHTLEPGESVGKHSNVNFAVRAVYRRYVEERGLSPFQIMLTIVDADAILSELYLAHVEATYHQMPDGRRLIYNGPLNTYRNFDEASMLIQAFEVSRCHEDVFHELTRPYHPQSNYSMSIGLAQEIDFWLPDCISEDTKCHVKALANNFGSQTTVSIPAFICNDLVPAFRDRYVQARHHQWGSVEELPWHLKLIYDSHLTFRSACVLLSDECGRERSLFRVAGTIVVKVLQAAMLGYVMRHRPGFLTSSRCLLFVGLAGVLPVLFWATEITLWNTCLRSFPIHWPSRPRLCCMIFLYPILSEIALWTFVIGPTLDCIHHITFRSHHLAYVNDPEG